MPDVVEILMEKLNNIEQLAMPPNKKVEVSK